MRPCFDHFRTIPTSRQRIIACVLLAVYVVTVAGVPLPSVVSSQKSAELFPCSSCGCGCATAEQCWRSCCCHTLAERMAWAHEHNVRPPDYAIAEAQNAGIDLAWLGIKPSTIAQAKIPSCCQKAGNAAATKNLPPCCQKRLSAISAVARSCCSSHNHDDHETSHQADHFVAWRALACHGQSLNWLAATPTLAVDRPTFSHDLPLVAWLGPAASESATCVAQRPDLPPPEPA